MDKTRDTMTDNDLVLLVRNNDHLAFETLMDRYQSKLLNYGRKFLSGKENIEDIVQEVFIKAYQNIQSFDVERSFSPWIYRIAHNSFVNALRQKKNESFILMDIDALISHPSYKPELEMEEEKQEVKTLIDNGLQKLTENYREVIILYYLEDFSYKEISDILHIPVSTVGVRLRRAKEVLKTYVQR